MPIQSLSFRYSLMRKILESAISDAFMRALPDIAYMVVE